MSPQPLPPLPPQVEAYLASHRVMTLATTGPAGPWAAAVFYVHRGPALYFLSSPGSRHGLALAQDARCAATIQEQYADWAQIQGIQLEGRVVEVQGEEQFQARQHYGEKFPSVGALSAAPAELAAAWAKVRWYRLQAARLCFIDNSRGFGHRDTFDLGAP
jgi:hypothetical protein